MKTTHPDENAFACRTDVVFRPGLTKREYFAALAMQGLVANENRFSDIVTEIKSDAVKCADALIEALNKEES